MLYWQEKLVPHFDGSVNRKWSVSYYFHLKQEKMETANSNYAQIGRSKSVNNHEKSERCLTEGGNVIYSET